MLDTIFVPHTSKPIYCTMKFSEQLAHLRVVVQQLEKEEEGVKKGIKASGKRVRKIALELRDLYQSIRKGIDGDGLPVD